MHQVQFLKTLSIHNETIPRIFHILKIIKKSQLIYTNHALSKLEFLSTNTISCIWIFQLFIRNKLI